jgi:DNA-binding CsgD family transcriptional regulator
MLRLSSAALVRAHRFLLEIHAAGDVQTLRRAVPDGLLRLIPGDRASFNEIIISEAGKTVIPTPIPTWWSRLGEVYARNIMDHPLWNRKFAPQLNHAVMVGDKQYRGAWERSPLYNEYFLPLGVKHQLSVLIDNQAQRSIGIGVNRSGSDFAPKDRALLNLLSPHIGQALRNALQLEQIRRPADLSSQGKAPDEAIVAACAATGAVHALSAGAVQFLQQHFQADFEGNCRLPEEAYSWFRSQQTDPLAVAPRWRMPFVMQSRGAKLTVRIAREEPDEILLLLKRIEPASASPRVACRLTRRESEILYWIREGKRNSEIGLILELSTRTVGKHVEHIFQKLGVETRTAAARVRLEGLERVHA